MTDHANELRRYSRKIGHPAGDVPSVMLAAADEIERLAAMLEAAEKERDALRAKIEAMERQEPVRHEFQGRDGAWYPFINQRHYENTVADGTWPIRALYALPGAQPAPSVPDWLPVPDKHPTFDPVDLQLADGSVLCGCVPQSDGDYWWEGPSGEVFIDPRYAPVTHWRLAAAPEVKL